MKKLKKISNFYWIFAFVLMLLAVLIIFVIRTMFSSLSVSNEIDEEVLQKSIPHLNESVLDDAFTKSLEQNIPGLDLRQ